MINITNPTLIIPINDNSSNSIYSSDECIICFEIINPKTSINLKCNSYTDHILCLKCYNQLMFNKIYKCPTCRNDIKNLPYWIRIYNSAHLKLTFRLFSLLLYLMIIGLLIYALKILFDEIIIRSMSEFAWLS